MLTCEFFYCGKIYRQDLPLLSVQFGGIKFTLLGNCCHYPAPGRFHHPKLKFCARYSFLTKNDFHGEDTWLQPISSSCFASWLAFQGLPLQPNSTSHLLSSCHTWEAKLHSGLKWCPASFVSFLTVSGAGRKPCTSDPSHSQALKSAQQSYLGFRELTVLLFQVRCPSHIKPSHPSSSC